MRDAASRSSVSAAPIRPGSRWCNGPIPLKQCVTKPSARVCRVDGLFVRRGRVSQCDQHTACPQRLDARRRTVRLRRERDHLDDRRQAVEPLLVDGADQVRRMRAGRTAEEGAFEVRARDRRSNDTAVTFGTFVPPPLRRRCAPTARHTSRGARSPTSGTRSSPLARAGRGRARPTRRRAADATSTEPMPLTWRSMKPGASVRSGTGSVVGSMATIRPDVDDDDCRAGDACRHDDARRFEPLHGPGPTPRRVASASRPDGAPKASEAAASRRSTARRRRARRGSTRTWPTSARRDGCCAGPRPR